MQLNLSSCHQNAALVLSLHGHLNQRKERLSANLNTASGLKLDRARLQSSQTGCDLTAYDAGTKAGFCYMWHEGVSKRGDNNVTSCVWNYINNMSEQSKNELHFLLTIAVVKIKIN